jgi:hypothetical protein
MDPMESDHKYYDLAHKFLPAIPQVGNAKPVIMDAGLDEETKVLTIIVQDGRKLRFDSTAKPSPVPTQEEIDLQLAEAQLIEIQARIETARKTKQAPKVEVQKVKK